MGVRISSLYGAHLLDLELQWVYITGSIIQMMTHHSDKLINFRKSLSIWYDLLC